MGELNLVRSLRKPTAREIQKKSLCPPLFGIVPSPEFAAVECEAFPAPDETTHPFPNELLLRMKESTLSEMLRVKASVLLLFRVKASVLLLLPVKASVLLFYPAKASSITLASSKSLFSTTLLPN
ncbi:hypothetical protein CDAR_292781 [Caerostris darwini]|uniref:Uncharacterized protein n=1 Tax=Caerostris darwini TaxID=1538125 RepID=A0AAV4SE30_9ARAC|nr:hypothetical protein CDAR_292781 [Caerostris darwini]